MGRSQRHKVIIQGEDSCGKGLSEKQPALRYINQYANSQAFTVPTGPAGGPLQGSTTAGFPPVLIPPPTAQMNAELRAAGAFTDPGQFNLSGNPIYTDLPDPGTGEGGFPPEETPVFDSMLPDTLALSDDSTPVTCYGSNFDDGSVIVWNLVPVQTTQIDDTRLTTNVDPATATEGTVPVFVRRSNGAESAPLDFTFTPAARDGSRAASVREERRSALPLPEGPVAILKVEKAGKNLLVTVGAADFQTGDVIRIEATGNSTLNGDYRVGTVKGATITIGAQGVDLLNVIEGRGRVTLLERG